MDTEPRGVRSGPMGDLAVAEGWASELALERPRRRRQAARRAPRGARALATIPGIGAALAARIHERLGIRSLEELDAAAHDGRLATVPGFGARRLRAVCDILAARLGPRAERLPAPPRSVPPAVAELLDVDREYRARATAGTLTRIAPRRFNPEHRAWLPVLHTQRGPRRYTALFSNTALAHELGRTADWVVLYVDDGVREREATVVTERRGPLAGLRVVRGREPECEAHYAARRPPPAAARAEGGPPDAARTTGDDRPCWELLGAEP